MEQLTSALEGYLAQSGNSSNLEIDVQPTQSQDSGARQFLVTVKDAASAPGQTDPGSQHRRDRAPAASGGYCDRHLSGTHDLQPTFCNRVGRATPGTAGNPRRPLPR